VLLRLLISIILILLVSCENPSRSGFDEIKTLTIQGLVTDRISEEPLKNVTVRFFAVFDSTGSTGETNELGFYLLKAPDVICTEFESTPTQYDPLYVPADRYFISATKTGYDTVTYSASGVDLHCFDVLQQVNFKLRHLNHTNPRDQ
jgi:hypothetical protein